MTKKIRIEQLSEENFEDYASIAAKGSDGKICYCSFWHQKWSSMEEYDNAKKDGPEKLKNCVLEKVRSNFHVGVVAYFDDEPCAWISVGPLIDFYWTWRRVAQIGEEAKTVAGITCFTTAKKYRNLEIKIATLEALKLYGKEKGWTKIEGYPFSEDAILEHGIELKWPGEIVEFENSNFTKICDHWLSSSNCERYIYEVKL